MLASRDRVEPLANITIKERKELPNIKVEFRIKQNEAIML